MSDGISNGSSHSHQTNELGTLTGMLAKGLLPVFLIALTLIAFVQTGTIDFLKSSFPPVEDLTYQRVVFPGAGQIQVHLVNGGPGPVTIAQVIIDDAFWDYKASPSVSIERLGKAILDIPYPWAEGDPLKISVVSSTGLTFDHQVEVATRSPEMNSKYLGIFTVLGIFVGVIPIFLGFLWLPFLAGITRDWQDCFLSFTIGLLIFLGIDAAQETILLTAQVASAFQGIAVMTLGITGMYLLLNTVEHFASSESTSTSEPMKMSILIALAIGLHNLGEGLIIGSAYAVGQAAFGTSLVFGFLLHNTTEGIGIVVPVANSRIKVRSLLCLGCLAGTPTIAGMWIGGFNSSTTSTVFFLSVGIGAVLQVVSLISRDVTSRSDSGLLKPLNSLGLLGGLIFMYLTGLLLPA
jgi:zinc transporter ZupT